MSWFNFSQPVTSLTNCFKTITTQASEASSYLTSKSLSEHAGIISKTAQTARSIPDYIAYSPEGAKYMRYANSLIPGLLFVCSGISFAVYASKTDSRSQKIAAYLLTAATIGYGALQIVDYLDISSCIGKEIQDKRFEYDEKRNSRSNILSDSFSVRYNPNTGKPEYFYLESLDYNFLPTTNPENEAYAKSRCF